MRAAPSPIRFAWAALLALLLGLRLIGATGYMPQVEHGRLTIIACPGADMNAPLALGMAHHHGHVGHQHELCPYAAAGALSVVGPDWTPLLGPVFVAIPLLLAGSFVSVVRQSTRERPPAIGPPFPA
jgi:hypothetical protein